MITTVKKLPKSQIALTVELEPKEWGKYRVQAIRKLSAQINIPGFRKGHVPEKVLLERLDPGTIMAETVDLALPQSYVEAIKEKELTPLAQPEVKILNTEPFKYEAMIAVMPEVKISPLKNVRLEKEKITVKASEIDEMLKEFQEQLAEQKEVDRAAREADVVLVDFQGFNLDGVPLEGTQSNDYPVVIGAKMMIPGFEEELIGLKKGEKKSFTITFPKDYHAPKFAAKKVRFEIEVKLVREKMLPELDEAFVEKLTGTKKPLTELRQEIEAALTERKTTEQRRNQEEALLDAVSKAVEVELPPVLIEEEAEHLLDSVKLQGLQRGLPWEQYLLQLKKSEEELQKELTPQAEKQVLIRLGIQKFLEVDQVEATEDEVAAEVERMKSRLSPEEQKKQAGHFAPQGRAFTEARGRIRIQKWLEQKIAEFTK